MTNKLYRCMGENFGYPCGIGYCGDVHTLLEWLKRLLPNKSEVEIKQYFEGEIDGYVVRYIKENFGKRLKRLEDTE